MSEKASKKPWQKPALSVHRTGVLNKFGAARFQDHLERIDGVELRGLMRAHGSPLFVLSERRLRENVRRLRRAFLTRYPKVETGWSYKTNYLDAVCAVMHQEGSLAEVVSAFEYEKARALGVPGAAILFNGPNKPRRILERAVAEGARIHLDNLDELYLLEEVARKQGRTVDVAIRLNFDTGFTEPWSRFGFNLERGEAMDAARRLASSPCLRLTGLHSHIGTFILDVRAYASQMRILCGFMEAVEKETGCRIESLDIGGGFASMNALQGTYLPPEQVVPSFDDYAEAITGVLREAVKDRASKPTLVLETGRALVDDAEVLLTSVVANKRLPDGRRASVLDAGVNLLFTGFWYNHAVRPLRPLEGLPEDTVLYGPLCMNIDVVRHSVALPPLDLGEPLVISPAGAYNNTQWMQFIEYRPAIVMIGEDGVVDVLRGAESLETFVGAESMPSRLQPSFGEYASHSRHAS